MIHGTAVVAGPWRDQRAAVTVTAIHGNSGTLNPAGVNGTTCTGGGTSLTVGSKHTSTRIRTAKTHTRTHTRTRTQAASCVARAQRQQRAFRGGSYG
jgi:hypothetical protein